MIQIKSRIDGHVLYTAEHAQDIRAAVVEVEVVPATQLEDAVGLLRDLVDSSDWYRSNLEDVISGHPGRGLDGARVGYECARLAAREFVVQAVPAPSEEE